MPDAGVAADVSPRVWYRELLRKPGFVADAAQLQAVEHLERLHQDFKAYRQRPFINRSLLFGVR